MPPQQTTRSIGTPYSRDALDDHARAERGRFDQRAVDLGARGVQRLADQQSGQARVDQDVRLPLFQSSAINPDSPGARRAAAAVSSACPAWLAARAVAEHAVDPPVEQIADRRLSRLDAVVAGHDRAVDDAADAGDVGQRAARRRDRESQVDVPMILTSVPARMPGADRAEVRVERRPWRRRSPAASRGAAPRPVEQHARRAIRGVGLGRTGARAARRAAGASRARKSADGRPPQARENIALWPAAQMLRAIGAWIGDAGEHRRDEVGTARPSSRRR